MRVPAPIRLTALLLFAAVPISCFGQAAPLSLDQVVSRMEQVRAAEQDQNPPYTVTREYQLASAGAPKPSSQVVAQVSYTPPSDKQYVIVKAEGSDRGTGIVRKVLDHEASMAGHSQPYDIGLANYDFALLGRENLEGRDCYILQLSPKRQGVGLVVGKAWVDATSFQVRRIDGVMAKSPSLWIKQLHVTINYGHVNGVWLQTSTQAVADVRLAGTQVLTSRELDVQTATVSATAAKPQVKRLRRTPNMADSAIWVAR